MTRSILFVPGDSARKFEKALASDADAIILDLEDSVALNEKAAARQQVVQMFPAGHCSKDIWIRVNSLESGLMLDDLAAIASLAFFGIVVPKCRGRETLLQVGHYLDAIEAMAGKPVGQTKILAIATETAASIFELGTYAGVTSRLWGLTWGGEDLAGDLGALRNRVGGQYTAPYQLARSLCLLAAVSAGVKAIDAVCVELDDEQALVDECISGFNDGFEGKLAIHPKHVATINREFEANGATRQWALKVVKAFEQNPGQGALRLDGKMIDRPHLRLAERLLGGKS